MPGDTAPDPIPGRPFVSTPLPEPMPRRSSGFYGRLVVIIVLASVALVTFTAYTIGEYLSFEREPVPVQEVFIGSSSTAPRCWAPPIAHCGRRCRQGHSSPAGPERDSSD
jgi:hypothetical protein